MIKKYIKILIAIISVLTLIQNVYAQDFGGEEIWIAWLDEQCNCMSYGAVANENDDKIKNEDIFEKEKNNSKSKIKPHYTTGYGRYNFNYEEDLVDFLSYCDTQYFMRWIAMGVGNEDLNTDNGGLPNAWSRYYYENGDEFANKQDSYIYITYFKRFEIELEKEGIDISELDAYAKGFLLNVVLMQCGRNGNNNKNSFTIPIFMVKDIWTNGMTSGEFINKLYDRVMIALDGVSKKNGKEEKQRNLKRCKQLYEDRIDDYETATKIGMLLYRKDEGIDNYALSRIHKENPEIFKEFIESNRFNNEKNIEWYYSLRNSPNYQNDFGIKSGKVDFTNNTTHGMDIIGVNGGSADSISAYSVLDNGFTYIPQNSGQLYDNASFGNNNIAENGAAVCCMSMAIKKLKGRLILPDELGKNVSDIGDAMSLLSQLAQKGGCSVEEGNSYSETGITIAKITGGEFTVNETYLIITGGQIIDGKQYVRVVNPNYNQKKTNYRLYDLDYIKEECGARFFTVA